MARSFLANPYKAPSTGSKTAQYIDWVLTFLSQNGTLPTIEQMNQFKQNGSAGDYGDFWKWFESAYGKELKDAWRGIRYGKSGLLFGGFPDELKPIYDFWQQNRLGLEGVRNYLPPPFESFGTAPAPQPTQPQYDPFASGFAPTQPARTTQPGQFQQPSLPEALSSLSPIQEYLLRAEDYLNQRMWREIEVAKAKAEASPIPGDVGFDEDTIRKKYKGYWDELQTGIAQGMTPDQLPYYQESQNIYGQNVMDWYNKYVTGEAKAFQGQQRLQPQGAYAGYPSYEEYATARGGQATQKQAEFQMIADKANQGIPLSPEEISILNQGRAGATVNVAPSTAFGMNLPGEAYQQAAFDAYGLPALMQKAKEVGAANIPSEYPNPNQPRENYEMGVASMAMGLQRSIQQAEQGLLRNRGQYYATLFPEWQQKYREATGRERQDWSAQQWQNEPAQFYNWALGQPEFKTAQEQWRQPKLVETPSTLTSYEKYLEGAFSQGQQPQPWEDYIKIGEGAPMYQREFTSAFQRRQAGRRAAAPPTRKLNY